jgi:hypothetical protein
MMPFWREKEINVCAEQLNSVSGTFYSSQQGGQQ